MSNGTLPVSRAQLDAMQAWLDAARKTAAGAAEPLDSVLVNLADRCAANGLSEDLATAEAAKLLPHIETAGIADLYDELNAGAPLTAREAFALSLHIRNTVLPGLSKGAIDTTAIIVPDEPPTPPVSVGGF